MREVTRVPLAPTLVVRVAIVPDVPVPTGGSVSDVPEPIGAVGSSAGKTLRNET